MCLIQVNNLNYQYQKHKPILKNIQLTVKTGGITALLGINGAGKSTLIELLTGQLKTQSGSLEIFKKTYTKHRFEILNQIALVPQNYAFYPSLSIEENLAFFAKLRVDLKQPEQRIKNALEFCQLTSVQNTISKTLSGGFKRRLNLAIGIINKPKLLFLDEPTTGIDLISREFILKTIKQLTNTGISIIYTSHNMSEIEFLCDQIIILDRGNILYHGDLARLRQQQGYEFRAESKQRWGLTMQTFCQKYNLALNGNKITGNLPFETNIAQFNQDFMTHMHHSEELISHCIKPTSVELLFSQMINHV